MIQANILEKIKTVSATCPNAGTILRERYVKACGNHIHSWATKIIEDYDVFFSLGKFEYKVLDVLKNGQILYSAKDSDLQHTVGIILSARWMCEPKSQDHSDPRTADNGKKQKQTETMASLTKYQDQEVAKVTLVNGEDVSDLSDRSVISQIKARKKGLSDLTEAGIEGAYFDKAKASAEAAIAVLQDELNSRVAGGTPPPAPAATEG